MSHITNSLPQGALLKGPQNTYCIERVLGQGTFGITYLTTTEIFVNGSLGSIPQKVTVAVKEFFMKDYNGRKGMEVTASDQGGFFNDYKRKFLREAIHLSKMQHPHIVKVLESFELNNTAYYAMEYLEGGSLDEYISRHGALKESEVRLLAEQIASALNYMHQHHMLHFDLKPNNIMLHDKGKIVLIDFGLAKHFDESGNPESSTFIGAGTPGYAPMEQLHYRQHGSLPVTMDIYALGATLYKMLTGECPPEATEIFNNGFPDFVLESHKVSPSMIDIIRNAMKPEVQKRFQNVNEILDALHQTSPQDDDDDRTVIFPSQIPDKPSKKNRWTGLEVGIYTVLGFVCVILLLVLCYLPGVETGTEQMKLGETWGLYTAKNIHFFIDWNIKSYMALAWLGILIGYPVTFFKLKGGITDLIKWDEDNSSNSNLLFFIVCAGSCLLLHTYIFSRHPHGLIFDTVQKTSSIFPHGNNKSGIFDELEENMKEQGINVDSLKASRNQLDSTFKSLSHMVHLRNGSTSQSKQLKTLAVFRIAKMRVRFYTKDSSYMLLSAFWYMLAILVVLSLIASRLKMLEDHVCEDYCSDSVGQDYESLSEESPEVKEIIEDILGSDSRD